MNKIKSAPAGPEADNQGKIPEQQTPPQTVQFQIPFQVPVQQPIQGQPGTIQLQTPGGSSSQPISIQSPTPQQNQPFQQPLPNVVSLIDGMKEMTKEGNKSEAQVSSQIILISSAIIAVVGVFALNADSKNTQHFSWQIAMLLIIALIGLGVALASGVMHFVLERRFWYGNRQKAIEAIGVLTSISNPEDRDNAAAAATNQMKPGSNRIAFYLQVTSFFIGVLALLILIFSEIIAKTSF